MGWDENDAHLAFIASDKLDAQSTIRGIIESVISMIADRVYADLPMMRDSAAPSERERSSGIVVSVSSIEESIIARKAIDDDSAETASRTDRNDVIPIITASMIKKMLSLMYCLNGSLIMMAVARGRNAMMNMVTGPDIDITEEYARSNRSFVHGFMRTRKLSASL